MDYILEFKYKGKRGYWSVSIHAENEEKAIKESLNFIKDKENIEKIILEKICFKRKKIFEKDLLKEEKNDRRMD